jgi:gamma-glutamyltranspeptidase/glutathione hydrolase
MDWASLWQPAIDLASNGLAITSHISRRIADRAEALGRYRHSAEQFLPNGRAPHPGERWAAPNLAKSLRLVADGRAEAFYRGEIAERLVSFLRGEGALFQAGDFAQQQAAVSAPLETDYRGYTVCQTAPPSQGFLLLEQLNILEGFDLASLGPLSADRVHYLVEAKKLAFEDRNRHAGDPAFVKWPLEELTSKAHAERRRREVDPSRARRPRGALVAEHSGDTSYFAVVDGEGNAVSFIHSLSASFGSAVVAGETGITLNNRAGRGFSLEEGHPNVIEPGKRTMHTLNAYLVLREGRPWLVGGTPGGDQQTQWNTQVITNLIDHGMSLQAAVNAPRWFSFPGTDPANLDQPMALRAEDRIPVQTRSDLEARGHAVEVLGPWAGGGAVQLIAMDAKGSILRGASDPRSGGIALGY